MENKTNKSTSFDLSSRSESNSSENNKSQETKEVYLCDECGDSMWDAVLAQEDKDSQIGHICNNGSSLLNSKITKKEQVFFC